MSNLDRKALEEKEKQLRKELNQASDEFENQVVKAVGYSLIGGLVSYGVYKLLSPKGRSKSKMKKASLKKTNQEMSANKSESIGTLTRVANAVVPIIVSSVGAEIIKNIDKD